MFSFSEGFRKLADTRLGKGWLDSYFENRYRQAVQKGHFVKSANYMYPTGRKDKENAVERVADVFKYYNDLKTVPTKEFIERARNHFLTISAEGKTESDKVKLVIAWINSKARYTDDSDKWGKAEYWSSPFDMWMQCEEHGYFEDDCDGSAVFNVWACNLIGVPPQYTYVWTGEAWYGKKMQYHANMLYFPEHAPACHLEGSFFPDQNQRYWLGYPFENNTMFKNTWFLFNSEGARIQW